MLAEGADLIDVGGESTRPGADPVPEDEELRRVVPVIEVLATEARVSVDTRHAVVAHAAIDAGASLVNDVSASLHEVAADRGVGWVAMHMQGEPRTMQQAPHYDDVVAEVCAALVGAAERAEAAGVTEIWIDPGIGFGKTADHNWTLLAHLDDLVATGWPVLVGSSRKGFLGHTLAEADGTPEPVGTDDRLAGSVATAAWAIAAGAGMVRVHDVAATVLANRLVAA